MNYPVPAKLNESVIISKAKYISVPQYNKKQDLNSVAYNGLKNNILSVGDGSEGNKSMSMALKIALGVGIVVAGFMLYKHMKKKKEGN